MKVTISNTEAFQKAVEQRLKAIEPVFKQAVETEKQRIVARTQQGQDMDGSKFRGYSTEGKVYNWRDVRMAAKPPRQVNHVDLTFDGDMFRALKVVFRRDGFKFLATIFFNERKQARKATGHHTGKLGRVDFTPRKFFSLSSTQRETIASKIRDAK